MSDLLPTGAMPTEFNSDADRHYQQAELYLAQGQLAEAVAACQQALMLKPDFAEVYKTLGNALMAQQKNDAAVRAYAKAIEIKPDFAEAYTNLATVTWQQGRPDEAVNLYRRAIAIKPNLAPAHWMLGSLLSQQGKLDTALTHQLKALELKPDLMGLSDYQKMGAYLAQQGKLVEAIELLRAASNLDPNNAEAHFNLGIALHQNRQIEEAITAYQKATSLKLDYADAYYNLGNAFLQRAKYDDAIAAYQKAIEYKPDFVGAYANLSAAFSWQERLEEAIDCLQKAVTINPNIAEVHGNLGAALGRLGKPQEAIPYHEKAIELKPDLADAHHNLANVLLVTGDYARGFEEYEWRLRLPDREIPLPSLTQPQWDGSDLKGQTILLWHESGTGDALQFIRYAPLIAQRGGRVIFGCPLSLQRLLSNVDGVSQVITDVTASKSACQVQLPIASAPKVFGTTPETIPAKIPYLFAPTDSSLTLDIPDETRLKVGIVWASRYRKKPDHFRAYKMKSCPLSLFVSLLSLSGVSLYSLQVGQDAPIIAAFANNRLQDLSKQIEDFADTAAFISQLDLIISVDTAVAHLAGAMGKPVWTLLPHVADWRWMLDREDSPWYPTMRLFRQQKPGDWAGVFERVRQVLSEMLG